jgi:heme O synthase-like polyprenyltransferase
MIPFCETEKQSILIVIIVVLAMFILSLHDVASHNVLLIFVSVSSIILELAFHEYREDEQYVDAKNSITSILSKYF